VGLTLNEDAKFINYARLIDEPIHKVDYDPFIRSQLAFSHLTLGPCVLQKWSRVPPSLEETNPSQFTEWYWRCLSESGLAINAF